MPPRQQPVEQSAISYNRVRRHSVTLTLCMSGPRARKERNQVSRSGLLETRLHERAGRRCRCARSCWRVTRLLPDGGRTVSGGSVD